MRGGPAWASGFAVLAAVLSACAPAGRPATAPTAVAGGLRLSYEDVLTPQAFSREGPAIADDPDGAPGFWAAAPGLPRPERARVENAASGATIDVALFSGSGGPGGAIRLSAAAAEAIGIGTDGGRVRVVALRREPRLAAP